MKWFNEVEKAIQGRIHEREEDLYIYRPDSVAIIGLGGIGSWIAYLMPMFVKTSLILVDYDRIEASNLHRTPYSFGDVGRLKVEAAEEFAIRKNPNLRIESFAKSLHSLNKKEIALINDSSIIIDCRDNLHPFPFDTRPPILKLGYDGFNWNIIFNPDYEILRSWDDTPDDYATVPIYVATPFFEAALATFVVHIMAISKKFSKNLKFTLRGNLNKLLNLFFEQFEDNYENNGGGENE